MANDREGTDITVAIPVYNRAAMLAAALAGVRAQDTHATVEVIAVDDRSTDDSVRVLERLGVPTIRHPENRAREQLATRLSRRPVAGGSRSWTPTIAGPLTTCELSGTVGRVSSLWLPPRLQSTVVGSGS